MTASTASGMRFQVATDVARQAAASLIACLTRLTDTLGLVTMASDRRTSLRFPTLESTRMSLTEGLINGQLAIVTNSKVSVSEARD